MRVKAKKRKMVPIVAVSEIKNDAFFADPKKEGERANEELCRILGKKIFEFCRKEVNYIGAYPDRITAKIMVVDMGKDGVKKKQC